MDCREFRNKHVGYVDDLLSAVEMDAMQRHLLTCSNCSRRDTRVRRSLMLVRSLPPIEASPDFMRRLNARIVDIGPVSRTDRVAPNGFLPNGYLPSLSAFAALAAGIAVVAYMAVETSHYYAPAQDVSSPSLVASSPDPEGAAAIANAALVASVPTGIPVWPAVLMAGQSPMRFASMEFGEAAQGR
ncbi:MAG TPA: zf-HC2 domain-containing protein [Gemmatimonadaceae bacterium]